MESIGFTPRVSEPYATVEVLCQRCFQAGLVGQMCNERAAYYEQNMQLLLLKYVDTMLI